MKIEEIKEIAKKEVKDELFRKRVDDYKQFLKTPWYKKILPWEITIKIKRKIK